MKHIMIIFAAIVLTSAACNDITPVGHKEYEEISLTKSEQQIVNSTNDFSFGFFTTCADMEKGSNIFISPMSLSIALAIVANGAQGETYDEIVRTLGLENHEIDEVNDFFEDFVEELIEADYKTDLIIANSAWVADQFPVKSDFVTRISDNYDATVKNVDFKSSKIVNTLNKWCSDKTYGMIDKMFSRVDPDTKMMIINALYFGGKWSTNFEAEDTYEETFKGQSGDVKMKFMHHTFSDVKVEINKEVQICSIPYGNGAFSMVIAMPADENADFDKFVSSIDSKKWDKWIASMGYPADVALKMPKFKSTYSTEDNLIPALKKMGINKAFTTNAEFGGISDIDLFISEARQNTAVEVDEDGTKAAAVTYFGMKCTSVGPSDHIEFNVDRPFVYAIRESSTNAILFIGTKVK